MFKNTVVVDFDGTIMPNVFPLSEPPFAETKEALIKIQEAGYEVVIHSVRTASFWREVGDYTIPRLDDQVVFIKDYLDKYEIPYDNIWLADKPLATYYIDDRAIKIKDGNWKEVLEQIEGV